MPHLMRHPHLITEARIVRTTSDNQDNGIENGGSNQSDGLLYASTLLLSSFLPWVCDVYEPLLPSLLDMSEWIDTEQSTSA